MDTNYSIRCVVVGLLTLAASLGCEPAGNNNAGSAPADTRQVSLNANSSVDIAKNLPLSAPNRTGLPSRTDKTILIASFNIQTFGQSKMQDKWVMGRLAEVIQQFDVVAIQEIRSVDQQLLDRLLQYVNSTPNIRYDYLLGPRLGRTTSKEQYAYIYDTNRILGDPNAMYVVNDGHPGAASKQEVGAAGMPDLLHREPLVARFVVNTRPMPFTFTLVNIHTDPDEVSYELNVLDDVYKQVRNYEFSQANEDDVILLGDLNAAPSKFGELGTISNVKPLIENQATNVRETELYDNILIDRQTTVEYTGRSGVLSMKDFFKINMTDAERLSDHNPVWAEFGIQEKNAQLANQYSNVVR